MGDAQLGQAGSVRWERVGRDMTSVCMRECAHVRLNAPTAHNNVDNFISIHVGNEQREFWRFPARAAFKGNQQSSALIILLLPLHKK